ncbi:helicase-related protein, partial [Escherichia coli]
PHVLVAHPECMSHGLTLTEASTIVWWGPPSSLETYEQANGRITRAGQRHSQLIVNMMGTRLEARVFKLLESRANVQRALLEMFERQDRGDLS